MNFVLRFNNGRHRQVSKTTQLWQFCIPILKLILSYKTTVCTYLHHRVCVTVFCVTSSVFRARTFLNDVSVRGTIQKFSRLMGGLIWGTANQPCSLRKHILIVVVLLFDFRRDTKPCQRLPRLYTSKR